MLPQGWATAAIGDLCGLINGKAFKPSDWAREGLPIIRIQNLNRPDAEFNYCDTEVDERFLVEPGELLFAWSGTPGTSFGAHIWNGPKAVLNQHIFRVRFDERQIDKEYFRRAINSKLDELINKAHGGVGLAHVTKGKFEATEVPVPPSAEQRRIIAKLDALMAFFARARKELDRVPVLAENLRQTVVTSAFRGELTTEWRAENPQHAPLSNDQTALAYSRVAGAKRKKLAAAIDWRPEIALPQTWRWASIDELVALVQYGTSAKTSDAREGVPVLRMGNIQRGELNWTNLKYLPGDHGEFPELLLKNDDVLFNRTNSIELVGKSAVFRGHPCPVSFASYLIRVRCSAMQPELLVRYLNSPIGRAWAGRSASQQVGQANINGSKLKGLGIPLPPPAEQEEMLRLINLAFARADRLEGEAIRARALLDRLEAAILAKAFRGELVPQNPNDEPAGVLLERIRAQRAAAPKRKRGRRAVKREQA
jgi:type I restriction enzyme, S subunit